MRYAALASGSKGNCHALADGTRTLLVDAGLSLKQIHMRLEALGLDAGTVRGVAISHEHSDHIHAIPVLLKRTPWPLLMTEETRAAVEESRGVEIPPGRWIPLRAGHPLEWEGWTLLPFSVPHDAADPVAFRVEAGGFHAAILTDLGHPSALAREHCRDLDLLVVEANHDVDMLREGIYPPALKARILSRLGHLSNASMAEFLASVLSPRLRSVVLAHLSEANNDPVLARLAAQEVLPPEVFLALASQREPLMVAAALQ
jgi:phosphoribosyl 1,2-cyclic phosphodiesterase